MEENKLTPGERVNLHLHYLDHFFRVEQSEEAQSEQRIKFFLTLTTGVIALLSIFSNIYGGEEISHTILAVFLLFLFLLGLFVFANIIWSDRKIEQHRKLWVESYKAIINIDPTVISYQKTLDKMNDNKIRRPIRNFKGTLTQIIWFVEGIIIGAFMFILGISNNFSNVFTISLSLGITVIVYLLLWWWSNYVKKGTKDYYQNKFETSIVKDDK